jgi:hypothetical protein
VQHGRLDGGTGAASDLLRGGDQMAEQRRLTAGGGGEADLRPGRTAGERLDGEDAGVAAGNALWHDGDAHTGRDEGEGGGHFGCFLHNTG